MQEGAERGGTIFPVVIGDACIFILTQMVMENHINGVHRQMMYANHHKKYLLETIDQLNGPMRLVDQFWKPEKISSALVQM